MRNPVFPNNYIQHICDNIGEVDLILASTHHEVRTALELANLQYGVVVPAIECKEEYLQRYVQRGSPESFVKLLDDNWDAWVCDLYEESILSPYCFPVIRLRSGENLSDYF